MASSLILAFIWSQLVLLPILGGLYLGIRNERRMASRFLAAIVESRRRPTHRRLRK